MSKWKYVERVDLGYTLEGKRIQKRVYGNSKAELERNKAALYRENIRNPSNMTFIEYAKKWRETYRPNQPPATGKFYDNLYKHLEKMGNIKLKDVERIDVQELINGVWDKPSVAERLLWLVKKVLQSAVNDGYIQRNVAYDISKPKKPPKTAKLIIGDKLLAGIKRADLDEIERLYVNVLYLFGLRPGEALALTPSDFKDGMVTISKSLTWNGQEPVLKETKTGSTRQIPIPQGFRPPKGRLYLFESKCGGPMRRSEWQRLWERIKRKVNIAMGGNAHINMLEGFSSYTFRRNFATDLYYSGISLKKAAQLMGHADTTMLLKVYAQLDEERETTEKLDARARKVI